MGGERERSKRQTGGEGGERRAARPRLAPAGIVCAARAPSPAPHGPATHTLAGARPSARAFVHVHPPKKASSPPGCAPREEGGQLGAGRGRQPRGGARPADSFPTRAGPSGETGGGEEREEMGAPLGRTVRAGEDTRRGVGARWDRGCPQGRSGPPPRD